MKTQDLIQKVSGNTIAANMLNAAKVKSGEISSFKLKIVSNQLYVAAIAEANFSFSSIQNYCRNINDKLLSDLTDDNGLRYGEANFNGENINYLKKVGTWLKLQSLEVKTEEILYSHLTTFGTQKELSNKSGDKKFISLNLFFTCLERYKKQLPEEISKEEEIANELNKPEAPKSEAPETSEEQKAPEAPKSRIQKDKESLKNVA